MIQTAGLAGVKKFLAPPVVLHLKPPLFNIDIGCAVFTHRTEFDNMRIRAEFSCGKNNIGGYQQVIAQRQNGRLAVEHGIRRCRLLGVVDDSVRLISAKNLGDEFPLGQVANMIFNLTTVKHRG